MCRSAFVDTVDIFPSDQFFIVFEFSNGGKDLESFEFNSLSEAWSVLHQTALGLAVAENALEFEHRDLHWGNVLICKTEDQLVESTLQGEKKLVPSHGVRVSLIDFTLSRLKKGTQIQIKRASFYRVERNMILHWFCFNYLCDWSRELGPPSQPIRCKIKKATWLRTFSALAGLFLFEFTLALFPGKFRKKKFQVLSEPDHLKTSFPLFTFSLMLNHFFWIKSPSHFFFVFVFVFFLLLQMAWRCFVTWQRMNRCSLAEETINLMCIGSWRKQTSTYCLTARVAVRKLSCLHCKCLSCRNLPSRKSNCLRRRIKFVSMAVNIWKSYIWTADKDVNMKAIFAVMNTA